MSRAVGFVLSAILAGAGGHIAVAVAGKDDHLPLPFRHHHQVKRGPSAPPVTLPQEMPRLAKAARAARAEFGVPVSVALGQAYLESGGGRSGLAREYRNLYGIKCGSSGHGPIAIDCVSLSTGEYLGGRDVRLNAPFRVYRSPEDSVRDWALLISSSPRYAGAMAHRNDPAAFLRGVKAGGYATDPDYVDKVLSIIDRLGLRKYDK